MRLLLITVLLSFAHIAVAKDYPLTAKVKSVTAQSSGGSGKVGFETVHISGVNYQTTVEIGGRVYTSTWACTLALAGESYPARIEIKKKMFGPRWREIHIRVEGKDCSLPVTGSEE